MTQLVKLGNFEWDGNLNSAILATFMYVGGTTPPTNTSAGDLTATRLSINQTSAFSTSGYFGRFGGTVTDTANGAVAGYAMGMTIAPIVNSLSDFRAVFVQNLITPATTVTLDTIAGFRSENRYRSDAATNSINAAEIVGLVIDSSSPAAWGTVTLAQGISVFPLTSLDATKTGTVTTAVGVDIQPIGAGGGSFTIPTLIGTRVNNPVASATVTTLIGVDIASLTRGATNFGIRNATNSVQSGYANFGAITAPTNVTDGDLTAVRGHFGTDGAYTAGSVLQYASVDTATGAGARVLSGAFLQSNAASNSLAELRILNFEFQPQASVNYTNGVGASGLYVLYRRQAGTGTDTAFNAFQAAGSVVGSGVLSTYNAFIVANSNANATLNRAFYSAHKSYEVTYAGKSIRTPSTSQTISAAGNTILADAERLQISNTTGGSITLTSAPTIADGTDGQIITIMNVGTANVVLQDQGTLASSNLRLVAASITLAPRNSVKLAYSSTVGDWVQDGPVVAVL